MTTIARQTTWASQQTLTASALNAEFNNIVNAWNNTDAGTTKWTVVSALNAASTVIIADNSTGTNNIFEGRVNGTSNFTVNGTGQALCQNGTNALPGLSFINDTASGLRLAAASSMNVISGGTVYANLASSAITPGVDNTIAIGSSSFRYSSINSALLNTSNGTAGAPSHAFINDSASGMFLSAASDLRLSSGGTVYIQMASNVMQPLADNSIGCGASGHRWTSVWAANGSIQTSVSQAADGTPLKLGIVDIDHSVIDTPRGILFDRPGDGTRYMGFLADGLPPEAFADDTNVYTSAVIGILCAKVRALEAKVYGS